MNMRREHGFTLLELMVVLSVIGLLSAAGAAVLVGREERQMSRHAMGVAEFLKAARRGAQTSGKEQRVEVSRTTLSVAGKSMAMKRPGDLSLRLLQGGQRIRRSDAILFYPDGSSTGGLIELSRKNETRRVAVDGWGRVHAGN